MEYWLCWHLTDRWFVLMRSFSAIFIVLWLGCPITQTNPHVLLNKSIKPFLLWWSKQMEIWNCCAKKSNHQLLVKTHVILYYSDHTRRVTILGQWYIRPRREINNPLIERRWLQRRRLSQLTLSQSFFVLPLTLSTFFTAHKYQHLTLPFIDQGKEVVDFQYDT